MQTFGFYHLLFICDFICFNVVVQMLKKLRYMFLIKVKKLIRECMKINLKV